MVIIMSTKTFAYADGICSGICDNHSTALVQIGAELDGKKTVRIQPTPNGAMAGSQHIIVDALELAKFGVDLETEVYMILEYKYDCKKPAYDNRMAINIMRTGTGLSRTVCAYSNDRITADGWQTAVFDFSEKLAPCFVDGSHLLNQFHLLPFGSTRPNELTEDDIMYIGNVTFTSENPDPDKKFRVEFTNAGFDCVSVPEGFCISAGERFSMPECRVDSDDIVFGGWQYDMADYMTSGYVTDEKTNTWLKPGDEVVMPQDDILFFPRLTKVIKNQTKSVIDAAAYARAEKKVAEVDALTAKRIAEILGTKDEITVSGKKYYVANAGCDANDGLSPETAWATIDKVNETTFDVGDGVFFNRGDFFRGNLLTQSGVTYAAYGEGEKPKLSASEENGTGAEKWSLVPGTDNVWKFYKQIVDTGALVADSGEGEFIIEKKVACVDLTDGTYYLNSDRSVKFDPAHDLENLTFFNLLKTKNYTADRADFYLRCDEGNPGEIFSSIEFLDGKTHTIRAKSDVTIDNLCVLHTARHGIGAGTVKNLIITNCEIGWIGGGLFGNRISPTGVLSYGRFGNGIEVYGSCDNFVIDNCYVYQCFDAGITNQLQKGLSQVSYNKNVRFTNNVVEYCCYNIEYFMGIGAVDVTRILENILYENNICRMAGFGWGRVNPLNAAHVKGWDHRNEAKNFVIRNNIFDRSYGDLLHVGATRLEWMPEFEKNVYIQFGNYIFGHIGPNPTNYMIGEFLPYDENVVGLIGDVVGDDIDEIYFLPPKN